MLALVRIALSRPYTFVVLALLILIVGPLSAMRTPTDIFPEIRIPVIAVVWQYTGLPPDQMSGRVMLQFQRALTTTVNDIEHIEATSYTGVGIVKVFFQPGTDIRTANAQVTAISQTVIRQMPPNITPPLILNYNASTVPIIQLALAGKGVSEQAVFDIAINTVRTPLITVPGAAIPFPFGGKFRQIQIDLDPAALQARGLSANDVASALSAQNLLTPVGTQKIGGYEYAIQLNNAPSDFAALADLPIFTANGAMVFLRDVAQVRDGNPPQTNIVHVDGGRSVLLQVLKNGSVSTLAIIDGIKQRVEELRKVLPDNVTIAILGDQSLFVEGAIGGVALEAVIAAVLTSLMILLFLGSWRSTVIIATSIPLAILGSIALLAAFGETLNIMTLGGLALAVGILVDDATVTIENINWHLEQGKDVETAIMDGARQIVTPAFVSLLCICIVFVPMFFLEGVARFLFVPMAEAVMFAMICSFVLSRTLVPTMANYLLKPHVDHGHAGKPASRNPLVNFQRGFEARFERFRAVYRDLLERALASRGIFIAGFMAFVVASFLLVPFLGQNFFPSVDSGQILMHARAPVGTRVEESANHFANIQKAIRQIIPPQEIAAMADNIGMPVSGINMTYNNTGTIGPQDGDIQIKLVEHHGPTADYVRELRRQLPERFPGFTFSFLPADIISQILNFGAPSPIDVQVRGSDLKANFEHANRLLARIRQVPGIVDARIQQSRSAPVFAVDIDRTRAQYVGLTTRDVTNSLVVNLAGSSQVAPTYWLNPANGVSYGIVLQTPQYRLDSLAALSNLPIAAPAASQLQVLGGIADVRRDTANAVVSQYDLQGMVQVYAGVQGRDLGAVAADVRKVIAELSTQQSPRIRAVKIQGQVRTMESAFSGLLFGLLGAIVLIYLLIVVNFQSWSDPFVIITALPAALAGIVWILFATYTTLSVPALTGAIMCMGVATANSVLVVSFARERLAELGDATQAALEAGYVRFRPVLMTALAMIIGMAPMALGFGEGGEQNAPLGRAVIGGLVFATVATLIFVPVVFSVIHRHHGKTVAAGSPGVPMSPEFPSGVPRKPRRGLAIAGLAGLLVVVLVVASGLWNRNASEAKLKEWTDTQSVPVVSVVLPANSANQSSLDLPGRLEAYTRAPIYARVGGFLKAWYVDIGAPVKAGQLLAEIEAPDLDQQLLQAKAALASAQAAEALATVTAGRWQQLAGANTVSRQTVDEKTGDLTVKQALTRAAQAAVDRLEVLYAFKRLTAPFDGIVTARNTDVGALIGAESSAGLALFVISDVSKLRLTVSIPQNYVPAVKINTKVQITVPEYPGKVYTGVVDASARSVDAQSGTTRMQIVVDNNSGELMPGAFANTRIELPVNLQALSIPAGALIFDQKGMRVATVDANGKVVLKPVTIARDLGQVVEIATGLAATDRVIDSPPDGLSDGDPVRVVTPAKQAATR